MQMYRFFPDHELACRCGECLLGEGDMSMRFMRRLIELREKCNFPFPVTSAARCADYNDLLYVDRGATKGTHRSGPHTLHAIADGPEDGLPRCHAIDIAVWGQRAHKVIGLARQYGFTGIGAHQRGPHNKRFIHLDDLPNGVAGPRETLWTY